MHPSTAPSVDVLDPAFDPWDPAHLADPYAVYSAMREQAPVHFNTARGLWFLTRYDDVTPALKDHRRLSTARFHIDKPHMKERPADGKRYQAFTGPTMLTTEPAEQTRLRRPASPAFAARALEQLRGPVQRIADDLLDRAGADFDVLADFAYPLPIMAIAELLGIPAEHQARFLALATSEKGSPGHDPDATQGALRRAAQQGAGLRDLLEDIVEHKRRHPGDDLISHLIVAEAGGDLSPSEMTDTIHLMMEAGHITTVNLIGNGLDVLLDLDGGMDRLRDEPELAVAVVEECLRFVGPVHFTGRAVLEDVEFDGRLIPRGANVILLLAAANRDTSHLPDAEEFVLDRAPARHLALGVGAHVCIGAALARMEAQVAFATLARRLPGLHRTGPSSWGPSFELRGLTSLPVGA